MTHYIGGHSAGQCRCRKLTPGLIRFYTFRYSRTVRHNCYIFNITQYYQY